MAHNHSLSLLSRRLTTPLALLLLLVGQTAVFTHAAPTVPTAVFTPSSTKSPTAVATAPPLPPPSPSPTASKGL